MAEEIQEAVQIIRVAYVLMLLQVRGIRLRWTVQEN